MDIAERYLRLAHGLGAQVPHLIDGYSGPPQWADASPRSPEVLLRESGEFLERVEDVPQERRREWLRTQGQALHTHARLLAGEALPFAEEVRGLYDISPLTAPLEELDSALKAFEDALPGHGTPTERLERLRGQVTLDDADVLRVAQPILKELRRRTADLYGLPTGEDFTIRLVSAQPWSGYNWPLGNLQSRIDINTDFPVALPALPDLLAHEGYPGHHTENAHKETELVRAQGWLEHTLQLLYSPQAVIAEGIATNALDMVMPADEVQAWLSGELAQLAGIDPQAIAAYQAAVRAREDIKHLSGTAAVMLYQEGQAEDDVVKFLMHYHAVPEERARQSLKFIQHHRGYVYTYTVGHALVKGYVAKAGREGFRELLGQPMTPGMLAQA